MNFILNVLSNKKLTKQIIYYCCWTYSTKRIDNIILIQKMYQLCFYLFYRWKDETAFVSYGICDVLLFFLSEKNENQKFKQGAYFFYLFIYLFIFFLRLSFILFFCDPKFLLTSSIIKIGMMAIYLQLLILTKFISSHNFISS